MFIPAEWRGAGGGDGRRLQCCVVRGAWGLGAEVRVLRRCPHPQAISF